METKKNLKCILCDTHSIPEYEDYVEWCEDNDIEPTGEDSHDYWDFVNDMLRLEWDDFKANMKYSKYNEIPCVITGHLGLWNGNPDIETVECDTLLDAVEKCSKGVDDIIVKMNEEGVVIVEGLHHDGRNYFEIRMLEDGEAKPYPDYVY